MRAIYKRELRSYFCSIIGYAFIASMTMFMGVYFMVYNMINGYPYFFYTLNPILMILIIAVPILIMRGMSDEHRARTDQLLLTSPAPVWGIATGRLLPTVTVFAVPMAIVCLYPFIIRSAGTAYLTEDYASILAFFLLGCIYIAIGLFISSLMESQFIAAAGTFGILLLSILWPELLNFIPVTAADSLVDSLILWTPVCFIIYRLIGYIPLPLGLEAVGIAVLTGIFLVKQSMFERALTGLLGKIVLTDIFDGIVSSHTLDVGGLVYYLSVAGILLSPTVQPIEKRRWS